MVSFHALITEGRTQSPSGWRCQNESTRMWGQGEVSSWCARCEEENSLRPQAHISLNFCAKVDLVLRLSFCEHHASVLENIVILEIPFILREVQVRLSSKISPTFPSYPLLHRPFLSLYPARHVHTLSRGFQPVVS